MAHDRTIRTNTEREEKRVSVAPETEEAPEVSPADLFDLTGRIALVTGGTRGLGRAIVLAFAQAGADVIVSSRKQHACDDVAADVAAPGRRSKAQAAPGGRWAAL